MYFPSILKFRQKYETSKRLDHFVRSHLKKTIAPAQSTNYCLRGTAEEANQNV